MNLLEKAKRIECNGCSKGVAMCHMRPCWGTVEDFKRIIDAGYSKQLMIDYYRSDSINKGENVYFLSGANNSNECSKANWNPKGKCSLLENDKCVVNAIKPTMGSIMCCKNKFKSNRYLHACVKTWMTQEGKELIEKWKKMVDYVDKDDDAGFTLYDGLMATVFGF
jgi:hypothetical protein